MKPLKTHFIGVGGIGMSALARLLLLKKISVSGSDQNLNPLIESMKTLGLEVNKGHCPTNLPERGRVVVSTGISKDNVELKGCKADQHEIIHRSRLLKELMEEQKGLLVVGSHGKTTTSSLLVTVLTEANLSPSWAVGGVIKTYGTNAALGTGEYFVAEGDESDGTHTCYFPYGLILTNVDEEHMEHFGTFEKLKTSFNQLLSQVQCEGFFFYGADDPGIKALDPVLLKRGVSVGFSQDADIRIENFIPVKGGSEFDLKGKELQFEKVFIPLIGRHNALNAAAVIAMAHRLNIREAIIRKGLQIFQGAKRRMDIKLQVNESICIEDYAHHPSEIKPTLEAIKETYPHHKLYVFYQPHRYTRTRDCLKESKKAFQAADEVFITDIYSAGEKLIEGVDPDRLIQVIGRGGYIPFDQLEKVAESYLKPYRVLVFMGAGDIGKIAGAFSEKTPRKLKMGCIFGGKSEEHEISLISAKGVIQNLDPELFETELFGITKEGVWVSKDQAKALLESRPFKPAPFDFQELKACDLVFPILHGPNGEDGTIQGLFEMLKLPYIGCDVESSAISMNKATSKKLAERAGVQVTPFVSFTRSEWALEKGEILKTIKEKLKYPLFVKATHLGSSIGVYKVLDEENLEPKILEAFQYDNEVLVENGVKARELECAIIGEGPWVVSEPGEVMTGGEFYDYDKKYGAESFKTAVQADLSEAEKNEVKAIALRTYRAIGCDQMARVDLFLTKEGIYFSEINPIPGFTPISLFPLMLSASGLSFKTVLTQLALQALKRARNKSYALV
ncbi:MAG: UDP-N-acetylmuramate--L-alanine ligase [Chlamydiia bacterium]|nr:UDP-N-acetylmuramate--L-alanine ligase [Chlamydiia bacterium]